MQVVAGQVADISPSMLTTEDKDTPAEQLLYSVEAPVSGTVALKGAPEESVLNFTQAQINRGEVVFVHQGERTRGGGGSRSSFVVVKTWTLLICGKVFYDV